MKSWIDPPSAAPNAGPLMGAQNAPEKCEKMKKLKHTKGPWLVSTIDGEDCLMVGGGDGSEVVADIRTHWPDAQVEANAHLIASAPELLEALRAALRCIDGTMYEHEEEKMLAAIAHAEGRDYHGEVEA